MGYNRQEIEDSLSQVRYDDVFATYLLLGRKSTDVCISIPSAFDWVNLRKSFSFLENLAGIGRLKIRIIVIAAQHSWK